MTTRGDRRKAVAPRRESFDLGGLSDGIRRTPLRELPVGATGGLSERSDFSCFDRILRVVLGGGINVLLVDEPRVHCDFWFALATAGDGFSSSDEEITGRLEAREVRVGTLIAGLSFDASRRDRVPRAIGGGLGLLTTDFC